MNNEQLPSLSTASVWTPGQVNFADVIVPLALNKLLTYSIPARLGNMVAAGKRVTVPVGRKSYTGLIRRIHLHPPEGYAVKDLLAVLDDRPTVSEKQLQHWEQLSAYYLCGMGEVMKAALPNGLRTVFRPLTETYVRLHPSVSSEEKLHGCLNTLMRAEKQEALLLSYLSFAEAVDFAQPHEVPKKQLLQGAQATAALTACVKKNILEQVTRETGRLDLSATVTKAAPALSAAQQQARDEINALFRQKNVVLLHGVPASGKTEIYIDLMAEQLHNGRQVLYLLPEIALTTQIIERLQSVFGHIVGVYHSKYNDNERAEIYHAVPSPYQIILGVRSSLFLPFDNLGLIIVDEEHETSYKQYDPAPRYHARDAAIMLAQLHRASVLLGTATPSIESYYNARAGKYGLVTLAERYHRVLPPVIDVVNVARERKRRKMSGLFSQPLLDAIAETLDKNEQVILFQNRRGYSPFVQCAECGYIPHCRRCNVSLTYHKQGNALLCHYCGASQPLLTLCPECKSANIQTKGFGTEKAEDELQLFFPQARIARLDLDAARAKHAYSRILGGFAQRRIDILVGTQMVAKGLDFEHVSLVGILYADTLLNFPDFRAHERSFQLMTQVSGRAGRKDKQGRVIIQTSQPSHPVIYLVQEADYYNLFNLQLHERREFHFPPYSRLISLTLRHRQAETLQQAAETLRSLLAPALQQRLTGPFQPAVNRIQNRYLTCFWIRLERDANARALKHFLAEQLAALPPQHRLSGVEITIDVDPM
ncbi:MAG: primosomal protein N' [Prevotellaceae bacterium]|jgi:primosomal protein N' (replication factor Y)|nr:primosomal protein N' [Prevotellaceae bacterium]